MKVLVSLDLLDRIARHCPRALSTYVICLKRMNKDGICLFTKDDLKMELHESLTVFKNNLNYLSREGVLDWVLINNKFRVQVLDGD